MNSKKFPKSQYILNNQLLSHWWGESISREVSWILLNILKTIICIIPCGISLWKNVAIAVSTYQTYCCRFIFTPVKCCSIYCPCGFCWFPSRESVVAGLSTGPKLCSLLTLKLIKFHWKVKKTDLHSLVLLRN